MSAVEIPVGSRLVDSYPFSLGGTRAQADALVATGVDAIALYVGTTSQAVLDAALDAGLVVLPVTKAGAYSNGAADELAWLAARGVPSGVTVFVDLEGLSAYHEDPHQLIGELNAWGLAVQSAGFVPGEYVGAPQPLTGEEHEKLVFERYWQGIGRTVDRFGNLAEPASGWCVVQEWHGEPNGMIWRSTGVLVDTNGVGRDHKRRLPVGMAR